MCRAISWLLAWELLSLLTQEVAQPQAERSGRTQRARQSCGIPCSSLMSCACCRWGWLRALLHGGSGRPDHATALVGPWPWLSQMGFIQDTCLAWSLFSFPFEERRSHGRGVTERLSRLSWTRTSRAPAAVSAVALEAAAQGAGSDGEGASTRMPAVQDPSRMGERLNYKGEALMGLRVGGMDGSLPG